MFDRPPRSRVSSYIISQGEPWTLYCSRNYPLSSQQSHRSSHSMASLPSVSKLFSPTKVGNCDLKHRVAMAPLTRFRANRAHVHGDLAVEYYAQRATVPGTLLITEATFISQKAGGYNNVPGIWNDEQVAAWKRVRYLLSSRHAIC